MFRWSSTLTLLLASVACGRVSFDPQTHGDAVTATDAPVANLIAWWKLDDGSGTTIRDSVGTTTGMLGGTTTTWQPDGGKFGGALLFTGVADNVDFGTPPRLANLPAVTLSAWLNPTSVTAVGGVARCFFDKGDNTLGGWYVTIADLADGDLSFGSFYSASDLVVRTSVANTIHTGTWSHVVATWDGTGTATGIHLYLDGTEVTYQTMTNAASASRPDDSSISAEIGCNNTTSFAGLEDDIKLFDRALSPAEILQL